MSKLFAGLVWLGVCGCLTASVRAQPSPPAEAAQAAAGMARGIAAGMLAPMGATGTPPGAPAEAASTLPR